MPQDLRVTSDAQRNLSKGRAWVDLKYVGDVSQTVNLACKCKSSARTTVMPGHWPLGLAGLVTEVCHSAL